MILSPFNSTYPPFWGKEIKRTQTGWAIEDVKLVIQIPQEFDFFNEWCGKNPINAKEYYGYTVNQTIPE